MRARRKREQEEVVGVLQTIGGVLSCLGPLSPAAPASSLSHSHALSVSREMSRSVQAMPLPTKLPIPMTKVGPGARARPGADWRTCPAPTGFRDQAPTRLLRHLPYQAVGLGKSRGKGQQSTLRLLSILLHATSRYNDSLALL